MDQVHVIRHKVLVEGHSVRRVAREMKVSRNTIRHYLDSEALVGERKASQQHAIEAAARLSWHPPGVRYSFGPRSAGKSTAPDAGEKTSAIRVRRSEAKKARGPQPRIRPKAR